MLFLTHSHYPMYKDKTDIDLIAGIIGSIEDRKQTHKSIQRAMADGCTKIKIFGHISDQAACHLEEQLLKLPPFEGASKP